MEYVNIALAKGRLGKKGYELFKKLGFICREMEGNSRKLIFADNKNKVNFILVKAVDVPTYVEQGSADIGIVGKDIIMEQDKDIYEVYDLGFGICKFSIASLSNKITLDKYDTLTIATKYPNVTKKYFQKKGLQVKILKLNGSVELAPLVGLSNAIVDIVESGKTLKENGLKIVEDMHYISARLVANKVSLKTKNIRISEILKGIEKIKSEGIA